MEQRVADEERQAASCPAAHGAIFALWLTAALATGGFISSDRYSTFYVFWSAVLLGAGLVLPLAALQALPRLRSMLSPGVLAAFFVLVAAGISFDVRPPFRAASFLGVARLLLFGGSLAVAWWNVRSARVSRMGLGPAMAILCLAWILCGAFRVEDLAPPTVRRFVNLLPLLAAVAVLLPGLPRFDPLLSRFRVGVTLAAGTLLVAFPSPTGSWPPRKSPTRSLPPRPVDALRC
jgi:hypothetical protein